MVYRKSPFSVVAPTVAAIHAFHFTMSDLNFSYTAFGIRVGFRFGLIMGICMTLVGGLRFGLVSGIASGLFFGITVGTCLYWISQRRM